MYIWVYLKEFYKIIICINLYVYQIIKYSRSIYPGFTIRSAKAMVKPKEQKIYIHGSWWVNNTSMLVYRRERA